MTGHAAVLSGTAVCSYSSIFLTLSVSGERLSMLIGCDDVMDRCVVTPSFNASYCLQVVFCYLSCCELSFPPRSRVAFLSLLRCSFYSLFLQSSAVESTASCAQSTRINKKFEQSSRDARKPVAFPVQQLQFRKLHITWTRPIGTIIHIGHRRVWRWRRWRFL